MPNNITTTLTISGPEAGTILPKYQSSESEFDFNLIIPMPSGLEGTTSPCEPNEELITKYGADNWYTWRLKNWGTKWNCYDIIISDTEVQFDTAWSCPEAIIKHLSIVHPDHTFTATFADEDIGYNCGVLTFTNGEGKFDDMSVGQLDSEEASIRWALTTKYGSDDDYEEWYGEEQN